MSVGQFGVITLEVLKRVVAEHLDAFSEYRFLHLEVQKPKHQTVNQKWLAVFL